MTTKKDDDIADELLLDPKDPHLIADKSKVNYGHAPSKPISRLNGKKIKVTIQKPPKIKRQRFNPIRAYFQVMLEVILS